MVRTAEQAKASSGAIKAKEASKQRSVRGNKRSIKEAEGLVKTSDEIRKVLSLLVREAHRDGVSTKFLPNSEDGEALLEIRPRKESDQGRTVPVPIEKLKRYFGPATAACAISSRRIEIHVRGEPYAVLARTAAVHPFLKLLREAKPSVRKDEVVLDLLEEVKSVLEDLRRDALKGKRAIRQMAPEAIRLVKIACSDLMRSSNPQKSLYTEADLDRTEVD